MGVGGAGLEGSERRRGKQARHLPSPPAVTTSNCVLKPGSSCIAADADRTPASASASRSAARCPAIEVMT